MSRTHTHTRNIEIVEAGSGRNAIDEPKFDRILHAFFEALVKSGYSVNYARKHFSAKPASDFKGLPTNELASILDNFDTIIVTKKKYRRGNIASNNAIYQLHQKHQLSATLIRNILELFEIKISERKIFEISDKVMRQGIIPSWIYRAENYIMKFTGVENGQ